MKFDQRTLSERAYGEIRDGLMAGQFKPGQPIVIRSLANQYGISITPVRDALQRLVAERLLEVLPSRSIAPPFPNRETFVELVRIRCALEGLAGELATPRLRQPQLAKLSRLIEKSEGAARDRDSASYVALNQAFHFLIYQHSGSPILIAMISDLWSRVGPFFTHLFDDEPYAAVANDQHRLILDALGRQDAPAVRARLVADIESAAVALTPVLTGREGPPHATALEPRRRSA